jgi:hypothetical protein
MGDRGFNAGGFAYMVDVTCAKCGRRFKIGRRTLAAFKARREPATCMDPVKCAARAARRASERR